MDLYQASATTGGLEAQYLTRLVVIGLFLAGSGDAKEAGLEVRKDWVLVV